MRNLAAIPKTDDSLSSTATEATSVTEAEPHHSHHGYFEKFGEVGSPFDVQAEEDEAEETIMDTNGVSRN